MDDLYSAPLIVYFVYGLDHISLIPRFGKCIVTASSGSTSKQFNEATGWPHRGSAASIGLAVAAFWSAAHTGNRCQQ